jgi:hypothetical protein
MRSRRVFARFLTALLLYSIYDDFTLSQVTWVALLSIAHRYELLNVRKRAIREIYGPFRARYEEWYAMWVGREQQEIQQDLQEHCYQLLISVAEKYDVLLNDFVPLLVPFVVREQSLTEEEVLGFSAITVSRLSRAREEYRSEQRAYISTPDPEKIVYRIWGFEVKSD